MKKTIQALFVLLFILIVVCAYVKSHTIYEKNAKEHTSPVHNTETVSVTAVEKSIETVKTPVAVVSPVKEKTVAAKPIEKQIEIKTIAQSEKETPKLSISESTEEEKEEEETLLSKLKSAVMKRLQSSDTKTEEETVQSKPLLETSEHQEVKDPSVKHTSEAISKPVASENTSAAIENIALTVTYNTSEEEIVDHLVEALKQQDQAFKDRDKFLSEIEALIEKALEDRNAAIAHRKKEDLALVKTQKTILDERDLNTKKIPAPYTINPGE